MEFHCNIALYSPWMYVHHMGAHVGCGFIFIFNFVVGLGLDVSKKAERKYKSYPSVLLVQGWEGRVEEGALAY